MRCCHGREGASNKVKATYPATIGLVSERVTSCLDLGQGATIARTRGSVDNADKAFYSNVRECSRRHPLRSPGEEDCNRFSDLLDIDLGFISLWIVGSDR